MHRRHMLSLSAGAALAYCLAPDASAQGGPLKRIGIPWYLPRERWPDEMKAGWQRRFVALHQRGWVEGRNLQFEFRDAVSDAQGLEGAARQLVKAKVDLIMAVLDGPAFAAKGATTTIPIVAMSAFPVEIGLVQSMSRPGTNITGVSFQAAEENGRVISLLRDMRPGLTRVGVPVQLSDPGGRIWFAAFQAPAGPAGIRVIPLPLPQSASDIAPMLDAAARERVQALIVPILPFLSKAVWQQIGVWATEHKVITRGPLLWRNEVVVTFGTNVEELERLFAAQIDRVLRGANPAETPFLQVTTWETIVNLRLARAVGWPVPQSVLLQATQVIE